MPVFADIDPETFTLDPASVERCITPQTRAILGVHLGGRMFDADALGEIARKHTINTPVRIYPFVNETNRSAAAVPVDAVGGGAFSSFSNRNVRWLKKHLNILTL
jgi:hypothetical protein